MESLPQHLRFKELWGGTDVDIEPEQCSNLFDSPFPFGIPPVIPDAENHANEILDDIWEGSNTHCLHNSQRCFLPPPNINSLLSCDVSMVPSELKVLRNLTSGTHEGYEEVFTEEDELEDNKQVIDLTKGKFVIITEREQLKRLGTSVVGSQRRSGSIPRLPREPKKLKRRAWWSRNAAAAQARYYDTTILPHVPRKSKRKELAVKRDPELLLNEAEAKRVLVEQTRHVFM